MKYILLLFIFIIFFTLTYLFMLSKDDDYGNQLYIGSFYTNKIEKIEISNENDTITIQDKAEIQKIIDCFDSKVYVRTSNFEWNNISGCGGLHWEKDFGITFFTAENELEMNFGGCDQTWKIIAKHFVKVHRLNPLNTLFNIFADKYIVDYDSEELLNVITLYMENSML